MGFAISRITLRFNLGAQVIVWINSFIIHKDSIYEIDVFLTNSSEIVGNEKRFLEICICLFLAFCPVSPNNIRIRLEIRMKKLEIT